MSTPFKMERGVKYRDAAKTSIIPVKIHSINARPISEGNCLTTMTITVNSKEHLDSIEKSLRKIEGVYHIERSAF